MRNQLLFSFALAAALSAGNVYASAPLAAPDATETSTTTTTSTATAANPADVTSLIKDCSSLTGWTVDGDAWTSESKNLTSGNGYANGKVIHRWVSSSNKSGLSVGSVYQEINVPNGVYGFFACVNASTGWAAETVQGAYLFANDSEAEIVTDGNAPADKMVLVTVTDGKLKVGLQLKDGNTANYVYFGKVALYFYGDMDVADGPADLTYMITDANCSAGRTAWSYESTNGGDWGNANGMEWSNNTNSNTNGNVTQSRYIERAINPSLGTGLGDGKLYQTVKGLPNGKYTLAADLIARTKTCTGVYLYAQAGGEEAKAEVKTDDGKPENFSVETVVTDGTLTIGVRCENTTSTWIAADNFTLKYYGTGNEAIYGELQKAIASAEETSTAYSSGVNAATLDALTKAITAAKAVTKSSSSDDINAANSALVTAVAAVKANSAAYEALGNTLEHAKLYQQGYYNSEAEDNIGKVLTSKINNSDYDVETVLKNHPYDTETLSAYTAALVSALSEPLNTAGTTFVPRGVNLTSKIANPSFTTNGDGWNGDMTAKNNGNTEAFQRTYDLNQTISGLPNGSYEVYVQGFQRIGANGDAIAKHNAGTEAITARLYANSDETEVKSLYDEYSSVALAGDNDYTVGSKHYANNRDASNAVFKQGHYYNAVQTKVTDGTVKIGVKSEETGTTWWSIFSNFQLYAQSFTFSENATNNTVDAEGIDVTLDRTLVEGEWNTLCVPFAISEAQAKAAFGDGVMLREYDNQSGNVLNFKAATAVEAGKAYLVKPSKVAEKLTFESVSVSAAAPATVTAEYGLQGIYSPTAIKSDGTNLFVGEGNKLYQPTASDQTQLKGLRAYFVVPASADAKSLVLNLDGEATAIDAIRDGKDSTDGGKVYNLRGQLVGKSLDGAQKGLYIVNGKKTIKK